MDAGPKSFLLAFAGHALVAMSGTIGVPLMVAGVLLPTGPMGAILGLTGVAAFVFSAYRIWRHERLARIAEAAAAGSPPQIREIVGRTSENVQTTDHVLLVDTTGVEQTVLSLPADPHHGMRLEIKKAGGEHMAGIKVDGNGRLIDGHPLIWVSYHRPARLTFSNSRWITT